MLEMVAITFDGAHTAERTLSDLRASRSDPWLSEVSIIEHDTDGRYSVKAKNPDVEDRHAGITEVLRHESDIVIVGGRTQLLGPDDVPGLEAVQRGYDLQPLSTFAGTPPPPCARGGLAPVGRRCIA